MSYQPSMAFSDDIRDMINRARATGLFSSPTELARLSGVEQGSLSKFLNNKGGLTTKTLDGIADVVGLKVSAHPSESRFAFIPKVMAKPSAGFGSGDVGPDVEDRLAFKRDWLLSKTTTNQDKIVAMTAWGDSMSPTFNCGDLLLVDMGPPGLELMPGKVYIFSYQGDLYAKRYQKGAGKLLFLSDNPDMSFSNVEIRQDELDGLRIIGKVFWVGKEL